MSAKTESIVRGWLSENNSHHEWIAWPTTSQECGEDGPVTILLHGPNGEVGGLEDWMVERMREAEAAMREASDSCSFDPALAVACASYRKEADQWGLISRAIARILATGGETDG